MIRHLRRLACAAHLAAVPLAALASLPAVAHAEDAVGAPLSLQIEPGLAGVDPEALQAAIAAELGVEVTLADPGPGAAALQIRRDPHGIRMLFRDGDGRTVERALDPPRHLLVAALALMAGNLARDEAAALLARRRPALPPPQPPPAPQQAPPPPAVARAAPLPSPLPPHRDPCARPDAGLAVGVDLLPRVGSSSPEAGARAVRAFSLGLLGGLAGGVRGVAVAGGVGIETRSLCGLAIAGGVNVVAGPVVGVELAPINIAIGPVRGLQLGQVNIATGPVHGLQLGVINIAPEADASLGLLNVLWRGRTTIDAWIMAERGLAFLGVEHGGRVIHNIYGVGLRSGTRGAGWAVTLGVGARIHAGPRFTLDLDALWSSLQGGGLTDPATQLPSLRLLGGARLGRSLTVLAGLGYSVLVTRDAAEAARLHLAGTRFTHSGGVQVVGYPGLTLGLRVL